MSLSELKINEEKGGISMRKTIFLTLVLVTVLAVASQAYILYDFDTLSPDSVYINGSYAYFGPSTTAAGVGIGGSDALELDVPSGTRSYGFQVGFVGSTTLDLSADSIVYASFIATDTSPFGITFKINDTSGSSFFPAGANYSSQQQQLQGSIGTTAFQFLKWNTNNFHVYLGSAPPDFTQITRLVWYWPDNTTGPAGDVNLKFYVDNIGVSSDPLVPIELSSFEALEPTNSKEP